MFPLILSLTLSLSLSSYFFLNTTDASVQSFRRNKKKEEIPPIEAFYILTDSSENRKERSERKGKKGEEFDTLTNHDENLYGL